MGLYGPGGSDVRQRHSRGHGGCRLRGIHARSGGHPVRDAAAKSDTIAKEVPSDISSKGSVTVAVDASYAPNEFFDTDNKTISRLIREDLAWRDRVFVSGAVRNDKNSAFGQDFGSINYPSITASWVVNEEDFFPKQPYFSSLRLRAANGKSGGAPAA